MLSGIAQCLLASLINESLAIKTGCGSPECHTAFHIEVIMLPKNIGGYHRSEVAAILFLVELILDVYHALGICISLQRADLSKKMLTLGILLLSNGQ